MTIFPIVPAGWRPFWVMGPTFILLILVIALLGWTTYSSQYAQFEVTAAGLRLQGDLYGRFIPATQLRAGEAQLLDLYQERDWQPVSRRFGTGLPGYAGGWFRLRNGQRALLYVTNFRQVVFVPTTKNYVVLLSAQQPEQMVAALQTLAGPHPSQSDRLVD